MLYGAGSGEAQLMDGFAFPVEVVRTNRKRSASIQIHGEIVKVRVPKTLSDRNIRDLITKRTNWITDKLQAVSERPATKPKEYVSGEAFSYLGKHYRLKVVKAHCGPSPLQLKAGYLVATVPETDANPEKTIRPMLVAWYQQQAAKRLGEKTARLAKAVGVEPKSVTIKDYKSRWGACSVRGDISYNWRIILTPHRIVDYVVVHELCHMLEHNHSPRYWRHVAHHMPDWRDRRDWLKHNPIVL